MARIVLGPDTFPNTAEHTPFVKAEVDRAAKAARRLRAESSFASALLTGVELEPALLGSMRQLMDGGEWSTAHALAEGVGRLDGGGRARHLGLAVAAHHRAWYPLAWSEMSELDSHTIARHIPVEAVETALHLADAAALQRARRMVVDQLDDLPDAAVVQLAGRYLAAGEPATATMLADEAARRARLDEAQVRALEVIRPWLSTPRAPEVPEGATVIGVLDYHQPDQSSASSNVGDYVQTLAMLGNLTRYSDATFSGEDGLGDLATELGARVQPPLRLPGKGGRLHLVPVNRDFSHGDVLPDLTWLIAFGWHMHTPFGLGYDFPYHPNVRPLFLSFHLNRADILTPEALTYLRRFGPVGCRDWTTVDLLLSAGVDAFFTGCLTTTVNTVFPSLDEVTRDPDPVVALIDALPRSRGRTAEPFEELTHAGRHIREATLVEGTRAAVELLEGYQRRFRKVVTSRLHAYLPATSLGLPVTFEPANPADIRFDGLTGLTPDSPALQQMQDGIRSLLAEVTGLLLGGAGEQAVYLRWRELTADRVADARRRWSEPVSGPELHIDLDAAVQIVHQETRRYGPRPVTDSEVTDIALGLDGNLRAQLPVTLESLVTHASGPIRLWILSRDLDQAYQEWVSRAFPEVTMTFLPCDHVEYGEIGRMIRHITVATMDRLLLPEILDQLDRITYIDIDTVCLGDICEVARTDLGPTALAARTFVHPGHQVWVRASELLPAESAIELRRRMTARHPFGFPTLNAGVLVLDLARMRRDRFTATYLPWVDRYGLNDQDIFLAYVGPDRTALDPRWNAWPLMEVVEDPALVHYLGGSKPWDAPIVPMQHLWQRFAGQVFDRVGSPPSPPHSDTLTGSG